MQKINIRTTTLIAIVILTALTRLIPHIPNLSPLGAISLFGAAYFTKKSHAFIIPIIATWLSDLLLNNIVYAQYYPTFTWFYNGFYWQYISYAIIVILGIFLFSKINLKTILVGSISASLIFYFISNFGCWVDSGLYPKTFSGLITCYLAALPFINGTLAGNVFYSFLLFGSFSLLQQHYPILIKNKTSL
jgi:hypothetical protein